MKTLHLANAYHAASGGIRTFYNALIEAANRQQRPVRLVVPAERSGVEPVGRYGLIYYVRSSRAPAFDRRYRMIMPTSYAPVGRREVAAILERERPDLVEICDKFSLPYLAAMLRKGWHPRVPRPALVGLSCERFDDNVAAFVSDAPLARRLARWYIRYVYGPPFDAHIAVSRYTADELRVAMPHRDPWFVRTCPMGVDAAGFDAGHASPELRRELLRRLGAAADATLLLYAGRVSPEKNVALLIDLMRELDRDADDCRLIVAGAGPADAWLRREARSLARPVLFCGNLDRETLRRYYATCDVFVHPNPREPFGIGPLEAMASGLRVVLPDAGGVLEYASDDNAWLAEANGPSFAAAVRSARRGDASRARSAAATARHFGWQRATQAFFAAYDDIHRRVSASLSRRATYPSPVSRSRRTPTA